MIAHDTYLRVRYAETDQMGYVYYGKYADYFEVGRVELIRHIGIRYREVEENGIFLPVTNLSVKYRKPARYDDLVKIRAMISEIPRASFLTNYEIYNENEELLVTGEVRLAFFDRERMRPVRVPAYILEAVQAHWPEDQDV